MLHHAILNLKKIKKYKLQWVDQILHWNYFSKENGTR